ncbi:Detected protein of unknown function [Hibiscus syriacus]|uniref:HMA domain-containing protein n=1 Tax=Hibiscus syriacus TaxID=106335 RepID=A0A6A2ZBC3_HIBSY|nr:Detected protein of unknown function [Hibiscus syriacus]
MPSLSTLHKNNGNQKAGRDEQKKENGSLTVIFKVDCLCDDCASRILKCVRELQGVETVKTDRNANRVTVIGSVDPTAIKDNIAKKSKKKALLTTADLKVQLKCQCQGCILKLGQSTFGVTIKTQTGAMA